MCDSPIAHSTPKIVPLTKRPGIREKNASVIKQCNLKNEFNSENKENSDSDEISSEPGGNKDIIRDSTRNNLVANNKQIICKIVFFVIFPIIFFTLAAIIVFLRSDKFDAKQHNIEFITKKYASLEEDFWLSFQVLISDSIKYNQPKCLILLYNDTSASITEALLKDLSNYAVCEMTSCTANPIIIEAHQFGSKNAPFDYGHIITQNKKELVENGVMIVKNMETISGQSAMAFQSLCDEYQPVVSRALIIFTLKMDQDLQDKSKYVEYILRKKWSDLNDDLFFPLLARISNFIFVMQDKI